MDWPSHRPSVFGVLYAEDFDEDGEAPAVPDQPASEPEIIEPMFTAAEVEAVRAEARAAGRVEAEHGLAASRTHMLGLLAAGMSESRAAAAEVAEEVAGGVARCMLSALTACLPALCEKHGPAELRALTRIVLPAMLDEPRITVRVHPHMLAVMEQEVAALDIEVVERVHFKPTDAVALGDVRISWTDGSVVRDTGRARAAIEDGLAALGLLEREMADA